MASATQIQLFETGEYCVRPYSSMSQEELVAYYTGIREDGIKYKGNNFEKRNRNQ